VPPARRWDRCFIRLLDGMLQVIGFADADGDDHALRIPVRIRGIEIGAPAGSGAPALPCAVERARGRVTTPLASITGLELAAAPRSAASSNTKCAPVSWLIASTAEPCAGLGQAPVVGFSCTSHWPSPAWRQVCAASTSVPDDVGELEQTCDNRI